MARLGVFVGGVSSFAKEYHLKSLFVHGNVKDRRG